VATSNYLAESSSSNYGKPPRRATSSLLRILRLLRYYYADNPRRFLTDTLHAHSFDNARPPVGGRVFYDEKRLLRADFRERRVTGALLRAALSRRF
jgi:hypothetical protein